MHHRGPDQTTINADQPAHPGVLRTAGLCTAPSAGLGSAENSGSCGHRLEQLAKRVALDDMVSARIHRLQWMIRIAVKPQ